ncbi:MAG: hypothetical protein MUF50_01130 [Planctomycetes bacterium]|jgi:hypothetical protein|nr:hypothetical protein [Planctomycetota bacterium]
MNFVKKIRITLAFLLFLAIAFFLLAKLVPLGKITYSFKEGDINFVGGQGFISKLSPADRLATNNDLKIIGDPVYFSLLTPRNFEKAKMTIFYEENISRPLVEFGVLADKFWHYQMQPLENKVIDNISFSWSKICENDICLWQKKKVFSDLKEFEKNPPARGEIAVYNVDNYLAETGLYRNFQLNEKIVTKNFVLPYVLRGRHQFYTYVQTQDLNSNSNNASVQVTEQKTNNFNTEQKTNNFNTEQKTNNSNKTNDLYLNLSFQDLNKNKEADPIEILIYYANNLIDSYKIADDGNTTDNGVRSAEISKQISIPGLLEGAYKIEIKVNDDILITHLEINQTKNAFLNKLWLYEQGKENINIFSDVNVLKVKTISPASLQTISFGSDKLSITETYAQFVSQPQIGFKEINLAKDGLILEGAGVFSFNPESFFNPSLKTINSDFILNSEINFILANYKVTNDVKMNDLITNTPSIINNDTPITKTAVLNFSLAKAYREKNKYGFIISIPGLRAEENKNEYLKIKEIKIELTGKSLYSWLKEQFKRR